METILALPKPRSDSMYLTPLILHTNSTIMLEIMLLATTTQLLLALSAGEALPPVRPCLRSVQLIAVCPMLPSYLCSHMFVV
jgi:hypothetical protein